MLVKRLSVPKISGAVRTFAAFLLLASFAALPGFAADADGAVSLDLGEGVTLDCVAIPAGTFKIGSPESEAGRNGDETQREIKISNGFWMSKYPVTVAHFTRFVTETKYRTEAETGPSGGFGYDGNALVQKKEYTWRNPGFTQTDAHPVVLVTWYDAAKFCEWLSKKSGKTIKLPTEAQWEYACRAKSTTRFYNGDKDDDAAEIAWFKSNSGGSTHPVGAKKPNDFGLFDMSGDVYQWCRDLYTPYSNSSDDKPALETVEGRPRRVLRGGSFLKDPKNCRSAARYRNDAKSRNADNGFRIVIEQGD